MASDCIRSIGSMMGSIKIFDFRTPFQPRTISSYFSDPPTSTSYFLDQAMKHTQEMQFFKKEGLPLSSRTAIIDEESIFSVIADLVNIADLVKKVKKEYFKLFKRYSNPAGDEFFVPNLAPFKIKPVFKSTTRAINDFEEEINTVKEVDNLLVKKWIGLAYNMGVHALLDIAFLQYFEVGGKTPAEIVQNPDCYLSYFLQKAKNNLSCWPIEQKWMGLSDEVIALSKKFDASLTEQAQQQGITLRPDYTLPSIIQKK